LGLKIGDAHQDDFLQVEKYWFFEVTFLREWLYGLGVPKFANGDFFADFKLSVKKVAFATCGNCLQIKNGQNNIETAKRQLLGKKNA